jgi:hypothetical protein
MHSGTQSWHESLEFPLYRMTVTNLCPLLELEMASSGHDGDFSVRALPPCQIDRSKCGVVRLFLFRSAPVSS